MVTAGTVGQRFLLIKNVGIIKNVKKRVFYFKIKNVKNVFYIYDCNRLAVLSVKLSIGSRSFSVSGPTVWNALPDYLTNPTLSIDVFKRYLKLFLFAQY